MDNSVINLYDFDGTIYNGHSSIDFYVYCALRYPKIMRYAPRNLVDLYKIKKHIINLQYSKVNYCEFLQEIHDIDKLINSFWRINKHKIKSWYSEKHNSSDVIITASPRFLVEPICEELGVSNLLASDIDKHTGDLSGSFCFNGQKIIMFKEAYPNSIVDSCYTDNIVHDEPLLSLAKNKYQVKGNSIIKLE